MNFADAIRKVSVDSPVGGALSVPTTAATSAAPAPEASAPAATGAFEAPAPAPASPHVVGGNVVRLELFLSAEQMGGLFRAIMAGQHTVMTAAEAAAYLRISKTTLVKLAEDGELPGILLEGRWRFPKPNLDEWLTMQTIAAEDNEDVA